MIRRDFLKYSLISSTLLTTDNLFISCNDNKLNDSIISDDCMNPIIPIGINEGRENEIINQIIELKQKFGFRRFMLLGPSKSIRYSGIFGQELFSKIGEQLLRVKRKLEDYGIEIGWECSTTLKHGPGAPFQFMTGISGKVSDISYCPLDQNFQEFLTKGIATVASTAKPFMISIEDDYTLSHAGYGCFCPLHLKEFSEKQQQVFTREKLLKIFSNVTDESLKLRKDWAELCRDSLVLLASLIRQKVDTVSPDTRILLCEPGSTDTQGYMTEAVTRAFAGKTKPAVRLYGTSYGSDYADSLPETIFHALYGAQRLPNDFELYHESDTFPHNRFFMSSAKIKSLMTVAFAYGIDESRFHPLMGSDNLLEETGYSEMYIKEKKRFCTLKNEVKNCTVEGCEIMYDPFEHIADAYGQKGNRRYAWANVLGRLGIPYTSSGGKVKLVSGNTVNLMNNDEILKLLSGSVFLDGKAAYTLYQKGFQNLIGTEVYLGGVPKFTSEIIRDDAGFKDLKGRKIPNRLFFNVATENGTYVELRPFENTKILTDFSHEEVNPVTPGLITFQNELGGRIAITAFDINNNRSSSLLDYKKKEIIRQIIEWLGNEPLPIFIKYHPNFFCVFNRSQSGEYGIVVVINLSSDPFDYISMEVAPEWQNSKFELLNENGAWENIKVEREARIHKIKTQITIMNPVILKLTKI